MIVAVFLGYVAVHFLAYVLVLRRARWFQQESAIFAYHLISAIVVLSITGAYHIFHPHENTLQVFLTCAALQGIYSISFLELWSLAQGGYSLQILRAIDDARGRNVDYGELHDVGQLKINNRLDGLKRRHLISETGGTFQLTGLGRFAARCIRLLNATVNVRGAG